MPVTHTFTCPVTMGLHARPAGRLAEVARRFSASITLTNERTGAGVNAKSILAIVAADVRMDDACRLEISGPDKEVALEALREFVGEALGAGDDAPLDEPGSAEIVLPRSFRTTGAAWQAGIPVSRGIGQGVVVVAEQLALPEQIAGSTAGTPIDRLDRLRAALSRVRGDLESQQAASLGGARHEIITVHIAIVEDVDLLRRTEEQIYAGCSAEQAVASAAREFVQRMQAAGSAYIRERAADVEDIALQILQALGGGACPAAKIELREPSIIVAQTLLPGQLLGVDRTWLRGLILERAASTSHVVILARSMGIPALAGMIGARARFTEGAEVIVDAHLGVAVHDLTPAVLDYYRLEFDKHERRHARLMRVARQGAVTRDGWRMEVGVNVGLAGEIDSDVMKMADGIGLLRTEMVFSNRETAPSEQEQFELFAQAATTADGKPVIIRTFDVGADKPLPYLELPHEENPFLGCRGMRNYARYPDLLRAQLRAIVRASASGAVRLMVPMVCSYEEAVWMREQIAAVQAELRSEGIAFDAGMPFGIMVEVPMVALALDELCEVVDFVSIGTNDLAQYFAAADRCNPAVARLADVRHPAFLRLLASIVHTAHRHGRWVGMCGDMASNVRNLPLLIGLGLDEISAVSGEVAGIKVAVGRHEAEQCRAVSEAAQACRTVVEVERLLDASGTDAAPAELLSRELTLVDVECADKAEAIKLLVDELYVAGRIDEPHRVEEAVWAREQMHTTGLGYGFAIPHCKCSAVASSSVAVARLRASIEWESIDGAPVRCVILLAMSEADQRDTHMKVFSTLARRLMHAGFRTGVLDAGDAEALHAFISAEIQAASSNEKTA